MKKQKHGFVLFLGLILLVLGSHQLSVYAEEGVKVAILPVTIHAPENLDYLEAGLLDMLTSRTAGKGSVVVLDRDVVEKALNKLKKDLNTTTAQSMAEELDADYIVSGSVTFFGGGGSIDFEVFARDPSRPPLTIYKVISDINSLLPEFSQVVNEINAKAFAARPQPVMAEPKPRALMPQATEAIPLPAPKTAAPEQRAQPPAPIAIPTEPTSTRPKMASIKQELIKEKPIIPKARRQGLPQVQATPPESPWKSQELDQALVGMDLGDLLGDGSKELVAISPEKVFVYRYSNERLRKLAEYPGAKGHRLVWVSAADINQNGRDEIFVTSQIKSGASKREVSSFVLEWDGKQFSLLLKELNYFLRAVRVPGEPVKLLGQKGASDGSFSPEVYEYAWTNNGYVPVQALSLPNSAHIYNASMGDIIGKGKTDTIMITDKGYLSLLDANGHPLWISYDFFGSTRNYLELEFAATDLLSPADDIENEGYRYAPTQIEDPNVKKLDLSSPILLTDLNQDGKLEIIVIHNLAGLAQLGGSKDYTKGEVLSLSWGGSGMLENWKTGEIEGVISSLQIGDLTGDGIEDLLVSTVHSGGITSLWRGKKTVIQSYALKPR